MLSDELLQRYYDHDLDLQQQEQVRQAIASDPKLASRYARIELVGSALRMVAEDATSRANFDGMFERIISESQKTALSKEADGHSIWLKLRAWFALTLPVSPRWLIVPAGAVAAALVLWLSVAVPSQTEVASSILHELSPPAAQLKTAVPEAFLAKASVPQRSEVTEVDFGGNTGAVFEIESEDGSEVTVLWIDEPEEDGSTL